MQPFLPLCYSLTVNIREVASDVTFVSGQRPLQTDVSNSKMSGRLCHDAEANSSACLCGWMGDPPASHLRAQKTTADLHTKCLYGCQMLTETRTCQTAPKLSDIKSHENSENSFSCPLVLTRGRSMGRHSKVTRSIFCNSQLWTCLQVYYRISIFRL
jgi:hypothetical protein